MQQHRRLCLSVPPSIPAAPGAAAPLRRGWPCHAAPAQGRGVAGRRFEPPRCRPGAVAAAVSRSPAMEAAPEQGACPAAAEADPCPEPPAHRLSAAELDRELDSRSELVRGEPLPCG